MRFHASEAGSLVRECVGVQFTALTSVKKKKAIDSFQFLFLNCSSTGYFCGSAQMHRLGFKLEPVSLTEETQGKGEKKSPELSVFRGKA